MKVLIFGSSGQLGTDLVQVMGAGTICVSHADLDITDGMAVRDVVHAHRPDWVVNTAAFHKVDECECNPLLAFSVNALGAYNVSRASEQVQARTVYISTDYVFGEPGHQRSTPYLERDHPAPINVYGTSKVAGEQLVRQVQSNALIIRTAGLYGARTTNKGLTFPDLMLSLARTQKVVRVVDDQVLSPTYTKDLAQSIHQLIQEGAAGIFHVTNAGECSWYDLAKHVFEHTRTAVQLERQSTAETRRRASRPAYSVLGSTRLTNPLRHWKEALSEYLKRQKIGVSHAA